jgi:hypothetical protein
MNSVQEQLFGLLSPHQRTAFAAVREAMTSDPKALDNHSREARQENPSANQEASA